MGQGSQGQGNPCGEKEEVTTFLIAILCILVWIEKCKEVKDYDMMPLLVLVWVLFNGG